MNKWSPDNTSGNWSGNHRVLVGFPPPPDDDPEIIHHVVEAFNQMMVTSSVKVELGYWRFSIHGINTCGSCSDTTHAAYASLMGAMPTISGNIGGLRQ